MSVRTRNVLLVFGAIYILTAVTGALLLTATSDRATKAERKADTNGQILKSQNHERAVRTRQFCLSLFHAKRDLRRKDIDQFRRLPTFLKQGITFGTSAKVLRAIAKSELRRNLRKVDSNRGLPKTCPQHRWRVYLPRSAFPKAKAPPKPS